jgi:hypothetical protein
MGTISGASLISSREAGVTAAGLDICDSRSKTSTGPGFWGKSGGRPKAISTQNKGEEDIQGPQNFREQISINIEQSRKDCARRIQQVYSLFIRLKEILLLGEDFVKKLTAF